jgi:transcriptional regulator with XRE-family HTH domain
MAEHPSASVRPGPGRAQRQFGADLRDWRVQRGLTQHALGERTLYSREFVTKVEQGERWPTADFARRADAVLDTGGVLLARWPAVEAERQATIRPAPALAPVLPLFPARRSDAEPLTPGTAGVEPGSGDAVAALVARVLREYPYARIVLAVDPGSPAPPGGQAARTAPAAPDFAAPGDGARVYRLIQRRAR